MNAKDLKNNLLTFSSGWKGYLIDCEREVEGKKRYYVNKNHEIYDLFINVIPNQIGSLIDKRIYKVKASVGQSGITGIPWIAIMDKEITESTQEKFYISYLFSRNLKNLHISLALGATQFEERYGSNNKTTEKITKAKNQFVQNFIKYAPAKKFDQMDLMDAQDANSIREFSPRMIRVADSFSAGSFFTKMYKLEENNFSENELVEDVKKYIDTYRSIVIDPISSSLIDVLDETVFEDSDRNPNIDFDYEIPAFLPKEIVPKNKNESIKKIKNKKKYTPPSKKVGDAGEEYVYNFEKNKLIKNGKEQLAKKIIKQYKDSSFFPGYDIKSFDLEGNEIYIEVKSTKNKKKSYFEISENEINAAKKYKTQFHIYHVTNALVNPRITRVIKDPLSYQKKNQIVVEPMMYRIIFDDT